MEQNYTRTYGLDVVCLADVEETNVTWLWEPYIPSGMITILEGDPESGKTFLSLEIAAAVTIGRVLPPFGEPSASTVIPANVVFLTGEDDLAATILPRFRNAGGDARRFFALNGLKSIGVGEEIKKGISLGHIEFLRQAMEQYRPALLVVDPLQAFLGAKVDMHRANEVRPILSAIAQLAAEFGCAVLLIRHFAKAAYGKATYKGIGSVDIIAVSRSVLMAGPNPNLPTANSFAEVGIEASVNVETQSRFVFVHSKCNLARKGPSIEYTVTHEGKLVLGEAVDISPSDLMDVPSVKKRPRTTALDFLIEKLSAGPMSSSEVLKAASLCGLSMATLNRAANELGVIKRPTGFHGAWSWGLPPIPVESTNSTSVAASGSGQVSNSGESDNSICETNGDYELTDSVKSV